MRVGASALACLCVLTLAAGCMRDDEGAIEAAVLPQLVLQQADVGEEFVQFDVGKLGRADLQPGPRGDADRFGRVDGWKARFRRSDPTDRDGVLVVQSLADLFASAGGAEEDLAAYEQEFEQDRPPGSGLSFEPVGEETRAVLFEVNNVFFCTVAWRFENVTASVLTQAFDRGTAVDEAFKLARKQQRRIAAAAGG
jgi:hypothetical protein